MLSIQDKQILIEIVRDVAKTEILTRFRSLTSDAIDTKSGFDDLVTVADVAAEKAMTERFQKALPNALIVGEEAVAEDESVLDLLDSSDLVLIIDPIDGTWNYANGMSTFGVLIAATFKGETIFGLLYDVVNDDWIETSKGHGTWYVKPNHAPKQIVLSQQETDPLLVGVFSPFLFKDKNDRNLAAQTQVKYARVIALRCCCHEYRTMLSDNVDFFISPKPNSWDHAAGILAIQEAGGIVQMLDGRSYRPAVREGMIVVGRSRNVVNKIINDFSWYG
ncbi:inositol monophosphatase family protein [Marinomonas ostreistagni]|uniref:Inositol monophosphatase n=1 Tax=Marinomonas ostreistagni TaxID=359209 RepID=A0ABS0ZF50_9GAMM|nr:inositol monophosphatase [Marinomonas ostreistagni]MBJ7552247.1 inositol monophosphatase [Marinomonas ostreistagni]